MVTGGTSLLSFPPGTRLLHLHCGYHLPWLWQCVADLMPLEMQDDPRITMGACVCDYCGGYCCFHCCYCRCTVGFLLAKLFYTQGILVATVLVVVDANIVRWLINHDKRSYAKGFPTMYLESAKALLVAFVLTRGARFLPTCVPQAGPCRPGQLLSCDL